MNTFILQGGHPLVSLRGDTLEQQPFSYGEVPDGVESAIGDAWNVPVAVRALPLDGSPAGADDASSSSTPPRSVSRKPRKGLTVVNAGGWGVFRVGYERRAPPGPGRPPVRAHPAGAGQPAGRHLGHHAWPGIRRSRSSCSWRRSSGSSRTPRPGLPSPAPSTWPGASSPRATSPALHEAVAALVGPQFHHLGFEAQPGEGERTPTLRSLAINLMGTVGDDAGVRAEAARRFDASPLGGGDGDADPGRRRGRHAGRGGPTPPAR